MHLSKTFHLQQHLIEVSRRYVNIYEVCGASGGLGNFAELYVYLPFRQI